MLPIPSTWTGSERRLTTGQPKKKKKKVRTAAGGPPAAGQGSPPAAPAGIVQLAMESHDQELASGAAWTPQQQQHTCKQTPASEVLIDRIKEALHGAKSFQKEARVYSLNLNTILSSTSYRSMMKQLSGGERYVLPKDASEEDPKKREAVVPTVTRAYEENFMREALPGERECARGNNCECRCVCVCQVRVHYSAARLILTPHAPQVHRPHDALCVRRISHARGAVVPP